MNDIRIALIRLPGGGHKVFAVGQPNDHLMDWRGCNFRKAPLPGQAVRGYSLKIAAAKYHQAVKDREAWEEWAKPQAGSHFSDFGGYHEVDSPPQVDPDPSFMAPTKVHITPELRHERRKVVEALFRSFESFTELEWSHITNAIRTSTNSMKERT